ncbi:NAD(P)-dependent dehydrogenase (short-subunit alcohol dehydrogenase family) [Streptosporangium becharense]|uniref:NAD(P)-dependent dehydrogenase (Short-subunit alcohol dehydrogenase family) n=1 Tax=Streptosporangium becharense TaxID=1816182 RepID=A0A7W9IN34_9ACTN|nr:SDR family oxidoreductase [Streptosporangium becharense]MBB2910420.1 NAD(P)-dependent dehydrogenase (short-subunit alcohol dehydrogenase family) [Streptosporangium becharense]MBB5823163.1 NAD(P)-dependent dehydrogenase (short-subunit alcohol dehydrogenase family) [Streptosporangium becharense]
MRSLDGKTVMITGAARALGRSHALLFAEHGADLLLVDLCKERQGPYPLSTRRQLEETARECRRSGGTVVTAAADVREQKEVDEAVAAGLTEFGRIDVLVNNAGLLAPGGVLSHRLSEQEWELVIDVNLNGTWRCCRAVLPGMVERRAGAIVNTASTGGLIAYEMFSSYVASKHAVVGLTKALALEYGRHGVRVNAVCPSTVRAEEALGSRSTAAVAESVGTSLDDYEAGSASFHALRRLVTAEEVSRACLWLAGDQSSGVTGTAMVVDAGYTAR